MAGALMLAGCARNPPEFPGQPAAAATGATARPPAVIVTPAPANAGRIASVNSGFVVITYPLGAPLPPVESRLNIYRAGLKVAEVKVSKERIDVNLVADITTGECQVGDEVRGN